MMMRYAFMVASLMFMSSGLLAQHAGEPELIRNAAYRALLMDNAGPGSCSGIELAFSVAVISFDRKGKLEHVTYAHLPACIDSIKFERKMIETIPTLPLDKKTFRNACVIFPIAFINKEKDIRGLNVREQWDEATMQAGRAVPKGKVLNYVIPLTVEIYEPVR